MSFLANLSPAWIETLYRQWQQNPEQLPLDWQAFFDGFDTGRQSVPIPPLACLTPEVTFKQSAVDALINRYRELGHLLACTDPLSPCQTDHPLLTPAAFGLDHEDLDRSFHAKGLDRKDTASLREILSTLKDTYCHATGVEFMHIVEPSERLWLQKRLESEHNHLRPSMEDRYAILQKLQQAALFERFLHRQFPGQKRFSLEGGEVLIPVLERAIRRAASLGARDIVLGMPHRGRLNVLANIFAKPLENIFAEFSDNAEFHFVGEGDVKYHKGFSADLTLPDDRIVHLTMASNPSHLEAVNPVVEGKARARQDVFGRDGAKHVLPILIHGDAAFSGQGIVPETLNLSQLEGFGTGGTLHIVLNNQIGFTTVPEDARSTPYATDVAKMLTIPIFHVHGENPEAAIHAVELALEYRQRFGRDVLLEIICYRRHGHNEGDEPYFTQPLMYQAIKQRPPVHEIYQNQLLEEGLDKERMRQQAEQIQEDLDAALQRRHQPVDLGFQGKWGNIERNYSALTPATAVAAAKLQGLAEKLARLPDHFTPDPRIRNLLDKRKASVLEDGGQLDWATAEALAFASLLGEGHSVRMSGQDCRRGTFSQRHLVQMDSHSGESFMPMATLCDTPADFCAYDSTLSEAAILGFEYGYSLERPNGLTLWEAQFGDFVNGAQVITDQFISSGQRKWNRVSGLVMLLPHGYEGQGPEHSSARIERFLQSCAENNLLIAQPTTPAQYFHLLRRQLKLPFRKPLIIFTPKSLLRHPCCRSTLDELSNGHFCEILPDTQPSGKTDTLLLCSGKIYHELQAQRETQQRQDVAIIRIEQLYPLREDLLKEAMRPHAGARRQLWVQEEPRNMGAWSFIAPRLAEILGRWPEFCGRPEAAAPAGGSYRQFKVEQQRIVETALEIATSSEPTV
ncbi:2-oxoglutarate dehydrogenase, E1 protein [Syntrophotalea carbinolica DSM 2380]|uniref:oxoglutarate dehydrogenase (succinyl-transferring) n=1 Tax=Syntrophotalea carbinolica (strain DSM 2380 / NBRC 103641 / GraBd1) TaxID=338963 RepID=Q3A0D2_SYNC1|nr:2-oxoglutarate dehydrogenase E1 component [Syntrophotalea carbinolica]ABA90175.1 2-oxoglutarate dehydrogenase, E1 protein [Syntrophotalea carbinolica DSM 2380]